LGNGIKTFRWAGNIARVGGEKGCIQGSCGEAEGKGPPGILGVYWRIIFSFIFKNWGGRYKLDWYGSEQGQMAGCCDCGNEPPVSIKYGEFD